MPSLNIDIDFFEHPKTKRFVRLLGKGTEVLPLKLWAYTARYFARDGRLTGISAQEIESEVRWWGKSGEMVKAMLETAFMELDGDTLVVHDWMEHEGHLSAFNERAKKGASARWEKARDGHASSIAYSNASRNAPTSLPPIPTSLPPPAGEGIGKTGEGGKPKPRLSPALAEKVSTVIANRKPRIAL